jgi:hypothetical protein
MKHEFKLNGCVSLVLIPENDLEKSILKGLSAQNGFYETSKIQAVGAQYPDGSILITKTDGEQTKNM